MWEPNKGRVGLGVMAIRGTQHAQNSRTGVSPSDGLGTR